MAAKGQMTGMLGLHLTAVDLIKRGFIVSPTSRSAIGADLLVTDQQCKKAWSVQVKTNAGTPRFWLMSKNGSAISSSSHVYVFVNVPKNGSQPKFYVVPSRVVVKNCKIGKPLKGGGRFYSYWRDNKYEDRWAVFGPAFGPVPARPKLRH